MTNTYDQIFDKIVSDAQILSPLTIRPPKLIVLETQCIKSSTKDKVFIDVSSIFGLFVKFLIINYWLTEMNTFLYIYGKINSSFYWEFHNKQTFLDSRLFFDIFKCSSQRIFSMKKPLDERWAFLYQIIKSFISFFHDMTTWECFFFRFFSIFFFNFLKFYSNFLEIYCWDGKVWTSVYKIFDCSWNTVIFRVKMPSKFPAVLY